MTTKRLAAEVRVQVLERLGQAGTLEEAMAVLGLKPTDEVREAIVGGVDLELALRHVRRGR